MKRQNKMSKKQKTTNKKKQSSEWLSKPKNRKVIEKAIVFDNEKNTYITNLKSDDTTFNYGDRSYYVDRRATAIQLQHTITDKIFKRSSIYYLYTLENPSPLFLDSNNKDLKPLITSNDFNQIFHSKIVQDVNQVGMGLFKNIDIKTIAMIGVGIIVAIYLFSTGQI